MSRSVVALGTALIIKRLEELLFHLDRTAIYQSLHPVIFASIIGILEWTKAVWEHKVQSSPRSFVSRSFSETSLPLFRLSFRPPYPSPVYACSAGYEHVTFEKQRHDLRV